MKAPSLMLSSIFLVMIIWDDFVFADSGQGSNPSGSYYHNYNPYTTYHGSRYPNDPRAIYQSQVSEQVSMRKTEIEEITDAMGKLPDGWLEYLDPASGKPYYYNVADRTTTWNRPKVSSIPLPEADQFKSEQQQQQQQQQHNGDSSHTTALDSLQHVGHTIESDISSLLDKEPDRSIDQQRPDVSVGTQQDYTKADASDVGSDRKSTQISDVASRASDPSLNDDRDGLRGESYESWGSTILQHQKWKHPEIVTPSEHPHPGTPLSTQPSSHISSKTHEEPSTSKHQGSDIHEAIQVQRHDYPQYQDGFPPAHTTSSENEKQPREYHQPQEPSAQHYHPQQFWDPQVHRHVQRDIQPPSSHQQPQQPMVPTWSRVQGTHELGNDQQRKSHQTHNGQEQYSHEVKRNEPQSSHIPPPQESWDTTRLNSTEHTGTPQKSSLEYPPRSNEPSSFSNNPPLVVTPHSQDNASDGFREDTHRMTSMQQQRHASHQESPTVSSPSSNTQSQYLSQAPPSWYSTSQYGPQGQGPQHQRQPPPYPYYSGPYGMPNQQGRQGSFGMPPQSQGTAYSGEQAGNMPMPSRGAQQQGYSGQMVSQTSPTTSAVKEALGSAWQGFLGFGSKTKEIVGQAKESVVQSASQVGDAVSVTSVGLWGKAKSSVEQLGKVLFEGDQTKPEQDSYSLAQYGVPPAPGQAQGRYPPQNYGGPPPGYGLPGPRVIPPYPHQQQRYPYTEHQIPPSQRGTDRPPLQSYWGNQPPSQYGQPNQYGPPGQYSSPLHQGQAPPRQGQMAYPRPGVPYGQYEGYGGAPGQTGQYDRNLPNAQTGRQGIPDNQSVPRPQGNADPRRNPPKSTGNPAQHPGWDGM